MLFLGQVGESASQIADDGLQGQQAIAEAMDGLWQDIIGAQGGLWGAIVDLGLFMAMGTLALFLLRWAQEFINDDNPRSFAEILWPLVVVVLLANNGAILSSSVMGLRGIVNELNRQILTTVSSSVSLEEAYQQVHGDIAAESMARSVISQCAAETTPEKKEACLNRAVEQAEAAAEALPGDKNMFERAISFLTQSDFELPELLQTNVLQLAVRGWLIAFSVAFQWIVEICWLLTGLLAPLAVGGTLFPIGTKALLTWLVGFYSVAMVKVSFNIIVGLVSTMVLKAGSNDPMVFAFATGLLAPLLSLALAAGGGMAILKGLSSFAGSVIRARPLF